MQSLDKESENRTSKWIFDEQCMTKKVKNTKRVQKEEQKFIFSLEKDP